MKMKIYSKYLVAPLSMLMVLACSPNQYQNKGEYDDIYFTKNDRNTQPEIVVEAQQQARASQLTQQSTSQETVPTELQEKYTNSDQVVYYEDQGPRVQQPSELNYQDFLYDYENEYLAYYDLPLDWNSDWTEASFNSLMATDVPFRLAWFDQYYMGDDYRMTQYLNGNGNIGSNNRRNFYGPTVGIGMNFMPYGPGLYPGGMMAVDLNPWGFNDPFWRPVSRWSVSASFGFGWGNPWAWNNPFAWGNPYYSCPPTSIYYPRGTFRTIAPYPVETNTVDPRLVRAGRLSGTSVRTVQVDSQNGSQIRTRSQRIVSTNGASGSSAVSTTQRTNGGRIAGGRSAVRGTNASITRASVASANSGRRVNTDAYRFDNRSSRSRITRSRVTASQVSSGRSVASATRGSRSSVSRSSVTRASVGRTTARRTSSNNLSFSRGSSSSFSRSAMSRSSFSRGSSSSRGFGSSRNSGFSKSSSPSFSRSSGSSRSSFSRGSSGSSSSRGSVSRSSSSSSRSSSVSRSSSRGSRN